MGQRNVVIEIDSFSDPLIAEDFHAMAAEGVIGVLIKVSQGVRWVSPAAAALVGEALAEGLLVGALHHVENYGAQLSEQREFFVRHLPAGIYELGLVLEVDPDNNPEIFLFSQALQGTLESMESLAPGVGLRCTAEALSRLSGAPWGARWWCGSINEYMTSTPWATWVEQADEEGASGDGGRYVIRSVRGLNIGGSLDISIPEVGTDSLMAVDPPPEAEHGDNANDSQGETTGAIDVPLDTHSETPNADEEEPTPEGDEDEPEDWRAAAAQALTK